MNAALNTNASLEPIVAVPQLACATCNLVMQIEGRIAKDGTVFVRYPCDSCKDAVVKVSLPLLSPTLISEHVETDTCGFDRNGSHSEGRYVCNCGWSG